MHKRDCRKVDTISLHDKHKCAYCRKEAVIIVLAKTLFKETHIAMCHEHAIEWESNRLSIW